MMKREYKSLGTNLIAAALIFIGYGVPVYGPLITTAGYFALSGAITNWLAIYMLFERIPFLYGSGVIPLHFQEFKRGIKRLIMHQFFTKESIQRFFGETKQLSSRPIDHLLNSIDFDHVFQSLVDTILASKFGGALALFGGEKALVPLKEPMIQKLQSLITEVIQSDRFKQACIQEGASHEVHATIEGMVDERLDALTPNMVKNIIQDMIREHLGWLVVWGGIFGGLIGVVLEAIKLIAP